MLEQISSLDLSLIVTIILAFGSFVSPSLVALINNRHHSKIRKLELEYDERKHQSDLDHQIAIKQIDVHYANKKQAFSDFLIAAGEYSYDKCTPVCYKKIESTLYNALLFSSESTKGHLLSFVDFIDSEYKKPFSPERRISYNEALSSLALVLNEDLASTKSL